MNKAESLVSCYSHGDYKSAIKPIWCPGCGHFGVESSLFRALAYLELPPEQVAVVSGIGCSSRIPAYTQCYGFHGVHGRAPAVAIGLKLARPELTVIVTSGDGDAFSIGGNHFIHACRRNVDMTLLVMDNEVYGMTKGQPSPTTPADWDSKIAPGGTGVNPFSPLAVALASGANFIARGFSGDPNGVAHLLVEAIQHPGFSFVQVLSPCVTYRPEEKFWKKTVHSSSVEPTDDPAVAGHRLLSDDGFTTGVFYAGHRPSHTAAVGTSKQDLGAIEEDLVI